MIHTKGDFHMVFVEGKKYVRRDDRITKKIYECRVVEGKWDGQKRLYFTDANGVEVGIHASLLFRPEFKEIR